MLAASYLPEFGSIIGGFIVIATIAIHLIFAATVYMDAIGYWPRHKAIVHPIVWFVTTLFLGTFGALAYWLLQHSTLFPGNAASARAQTIAAATQPQRPPL